MITFSSAPTIFCFFTVNIASLPFSTLSIDASHKSSFSLSQRQAKEKEWLSTVRTVIIFSEISTNEWPPVRRDQRQCERLGRKHRSVQQWTKCLKTFDCVIENQKSRQATIPATVREATVTDALSEFVQLSSTEQQSVLKQVTKSLKVVINTKRVLDFLRWMQDSFCMYVSSKSKRRPKPTDIRCIDQRRW